MRVLHVIATLDPKTGGVRQAVHNMIKGLSDIGIENEVVSMDAPESAFLSAESFIVHTQGPWKGPWCYCSNFIPWLVKNMCRYDVVIIHGLWLYTGYAVWKAFKIFNKQQNGSAQRHNSSPKIFIMPHGMLDPYFQRDRGRKLKALRNRIYWNTIEAKVVNSAAKILFTTNEECTLAKETFGSYKPRKEIVIGLGIDEPPVFKPEMQKAFIEKCNLLQDHSYFLFIGRIHNKKGVDLLISAYENLCNQVKKETSCLDDNLLILNKLPRLVIAGPNLESPYGQEMQRVVSQSPALKKRVFFVGMLSGDAKWGAFYGCEAFVLPSHQENFGIAVVEALACSKPVLISNRINLWKQILQHKAGFVCQDTIKGTSELLVTWCKLSKNQKMNLKKSARQLYLSSFTLRQTTEYLSRELSTI